MHQIPKTTNKIRKEKKKTQPSFLPSCLPLLSPCLPSVLAGSIHRPTFLFLLSARIKTFATVPCLGIFFCSVFSSKHKTPQKFCQKIFWDLFLFYMYGYFALMYVCVPYACSVLLQARGRCQISLELELEMTASHYVGVGNGTLSSQEG